MKLQCDACGMAEAIVLCCADEAALCWACDARVHAANTLAGKHKRFPLLSGGGASASTASRAAKCDICKEASAYFLCLEDRALFCLDCDVAVHSSNQYVLVHQRFLLTGVQVGRQAIEPVTLTTSNHLNTIGRTKESLPTPLFHGTNGSFSCPLGRDLNVPAGFRAPGSAPDWPLDGGLFVIPDSNRNLGFAEQNSTKPDDQKLGIALESESCFPPIEELTYDKCLEQLPELLWTVLASPAIPRESGLNLQKNQHGSAAAETTDFVVLQFWESILVKKENVNPRRGEIRIANSFVNRRLCTAVIT